MTRSNWHSLNGLWEFDSSTEGAKPVFGKTLKQTVLVPFPVESCLSGLKNLSTGLNVPPTYEHMIYRTIIDGTTVRAENRDGDVLLHFGAVDWQTDAYVNGIWVGSHEGGYDGFSFSIGSALGRSGKDEILLQVYDPSNHGSQPFGKQRTSSMWRPAGDTYSPVSGIWQPVWIESVPARYIKSLKIAADTTKLNVNVVTNTPDAESVKISVSAHGHIVAKGKGKANFPFSIAILQPHLWSPEDPFLYNMTVTYGSDVVGSYFGMREVSLCKDPELVTRPCINQKYRFLSGVLDQSYWPDGKYTAPGDEALVSDLLAVKSWGMNFIRLHQKVNPERWYFAADKLGIAVAQDAVQHYGDSTQGPGAPYQSNNGHARAPYYWSDLKALVDGRGNHPSIIQYEVFNEADMVRDFQASSAVNWVKMYDPTRLVDTDSGGPANAEKIGDVNDLHAGAPNPEHPLPSKTQYAMDGEYGNIEVYIDGHTWTNSSARKEVCRLYRWAGGDHDPPSPHGNIEAHNTSAQIVNMTAMLIAYGDVSSAGYVQLTDTEMECDGILSYDRTSKFNKSDLAAIRNANIALVAKPIQCRPLDDHTMPTAFPHWLHGSSEGTLGHGVAMPIFV